MKIKLIKVSKSNKKNKKYDALFEVDNDKIIYDKEVSFGYDDPEDTNNDYTRHKDKERRNLYIIRHAVDLRTGDPIRPGFLSLFMLWNKPDLKQSIKDYVNRLNKYNKTGIFPIRDLLEKAYVADIEIKNLEKAQVKKAE